MCRTDSEVFKRRLVHGLTLIIMAFYNFVLLLKSLIANVLKCKARFKSKFKCVCTMCSLMMSLFSRDYTKMEID